ncbi:MAG: 2-hydroxyacid dehydrogenase, partial [Bdellovibrionota bacterium]
MKIAVFDTHRFEQKYLDGANQKFGHRLTYFEPRLTPDTAKLAQGQEVVCSFTNDQLNRASLKILKEEGVRLIALRSAGFNHVDLQAAEDFGLKVVRVPAYSPHAVAEHAIALILALNRKLCRASSRVRELNFSLEGLVGFDLFGKTAGILGTGRIGAIAARILQGFGCQVLAYDRNPDPELQGAGVRYVDLQDLLRASDILSLHVPLNPGTHHLIDEAALAQMKSGVMLINTGRGALIDAKALISALKTGKIGAAGLDVYEEEENVFFQDLSDRVLQDDVLARLLTFPNVMITSHQAFLTQEALTNIAETTL